MKIPTTNIRSAMASILTLMKKGLVSSDILLIVVPIVASLGGVSGTDSPSPYKSYFLFFTKFPKSDGSSDNFAGHCDYVVPVPL